MRLGIMQPYFFPYIGYFQLMNAVDEFVLYDNIEYTKKGWINRNRILINGKDVFVTLPLKKDSDYLNVADRFLADKMMTLLPWISTERGILWNRIIAYYKKAPYFNDVYALIENCLLYEDNNLFGFLLFSLTMVKRYLGIQTPFVTSSTIPIDHNLKSQDKVLAICKARQATTYINPIGGVDLYQKEDFGKAGINLQFLKANEIEYKQFDNKFVPWLSIIDVMMFNSREEIHKMLADFTIV
jgi:hypothetical protein